MHLYKLKTHFLNILPLAKIKLYIIQNKACQNQGKKNNISEWRDNFSKPLLQLKHIQPSKKATFHYIKRKTFRGFTLFVGATNQQKVFFFA